MKKLFYGALIGFIFALVLVSTSANTISAPLLTYVYSDSMEPLIKVNDAFLVWPSGEYKVGDIIMFRPVVLQAPYITHRIIAIGENGFITKGDNSPYMDQESGEPEVIAERIAGKVLTFHGQPFIIPELGKFSSTIQAEMGNLTKYLSGIFLFLGIIAAVVGNRRSIRKKKPRRRRRLRDFYRYLVIISMVLVMLSIYFGARVTQVKYLVSEYPGDRGDQVEVNQPGELSMVIKNNGIIPVWTVLTGVAPLYISDAPEYIGARSEETVFLKVSPQRETGIYQGYVQIFHYPILLPRTITLKLHQWNPIYAILSLGLTFGLWLKLLFKLLSQIHGFEGWIPLKSIKDKITDRRYKHLRAKLIGRRRVR
ncbi:MAG: hypothetical protein K0S76_1634 [Herbinix sp.]|jgi:signal peptidase|nr:hypothetical protein [Herbinix sp.]